MVEARTSVPAIWQVSPHPPKDSHHMGTYPPTPGSLGGDQDLALGDKPHASQDPGMEPRGQDQRCQGAGRGIDENSADLFLPVPPCLPSSP